MTSKLDSQNIMYHTIQNVSLSCKIILCTLNRSSKDSELKKYEIKNITISSLRFVFEYHVAIEVFCTAEVKPV